jgi:hypothetical protein
MFPYIVEMEMTAMGFDDRRRLHVPGMLSMKRARSKNKGHIDIMSNSSVEHQGNGSYSTNKPATYHQSFS